MKHKKKFMSYKIKHEGDLPSELSGDYKLGFKFNLPNNIPSSVMFKDKHNHFKPEVKVKYYVKAKILSDNEDMEIKHKAVMAVREQAEELKEKTTIEETSNIKTCMCCD